MLFIRRHWVKLGIPDTEGLQLGNSHKTRPDDKACWCQMSVFTSNPCPKRFAHLFIWLTAWCIHVVQVMQEAFVRYVSACFNHCVYASLFSFNLIKSTCLFIFYICNCSCTSQKQCETESRLHGDGVNSISYSPVYFFNAQRNSIFCQNTAHSLHEAESTYRFNTSI